MPDQKGRLEILNVHARNKKLGEDVDLKEVASRCPGFTGADLANLLNEVKQLTTVGCCHGPAPYKRSHIIAFAFASLCWRHMVEYSIVVCFCPLLLGMCTL